VKPTTRFYVTYFAAWIPFAVAYGTIVAVFDGATALDGVASALVNVGAAATLGLAVHAVVRRIQSRRLHGAASSAVYLLLASLYGVVLTSITATSIAFGAPPEVFRRFMDFAFWWQMLTGGVLGSLLIAVFTAIEAARRLREQEARAARSEAMRIRSELHALRAQLNPHFLFNTLHSITALVRSDPKAVEDALERFGNLLRYVLELHRDQIDEVPLADEIGFARHYLALEQLRLGDRLTVREEIDPETLDCSVLSFSLQPLVENAVRHGVAPSMRGGTLRIASRFEGERLVLEVGDDGAGAEQESVKRSDGLGLDAVAQRLEARFGKDAHLDVVTAPNQGFLARITMPAAVRPLALRTTGETIAAR
jgi:signal transduction histidine kinase